MSSSKVSILPFGSLINDPGPELEPLITRTTDINTPFGVEYGRLSRSRGGAPTLVPHPLGEPVRAMVLHLLPSVSLDEARNVLWRRERRKEFTSEAYIEGYGVNTVLVRVVESPDALRLLYTDFTAAGKITLPTSDLLANAAISSVLQTEEGLDGISYLMNALSNGISTRLTQSYEKAVLEKTGTQSLAEALGTLRRLG